MLVRDFSKILDLITGKREQALETEPAFYISYNDDSRKREQENVCMGRMQLRPDQICYQIVDKDYVLI
ncbi:MAG: hypothetical protein K2K56_06790 [Lachnospiraceae bacterium]|nr:hypothetical protein [Lachnospiraceae bacterium]